ncbi:3',5'-cyclic adenosine monophosphate phosphodiesterase CpdA [Methylovulum psychrotolerans]|uniref:3',5'-cyclic adenosine monophosphate phosphodiesterase CpdA n=2 Tax=Methylovulum psychrotolerans TaxID=1704499 RepID=A0A2S5CFQ0_9GAMM|nr:3',5'-cyclic adenosine monophosphate phosphodiesterase CpdA [Methylovulum psychrotolerans]
MAALDCDMAIQLDGGIERLVELCNLGFYDEIQQQKPSDAPKDQVTQPGIKENMKMQSPLFPKPSGDFPTVVEDTKGSTIQNEPASAKWEPVNSSKSSEGLTANNSTSGNDRDGRDGAKERDESCSLTDSADSREEMVDQQQSVESFFKRFVKMVSSNEKSLNANSEASDDPTAQTDLIGNPVQSISNNLNYLNPLETTDDMPVPLLDRATDSEQPAFDAFLCHNSSDKSSKSIVWLHLSDLHLCEPKTGWDANRVLNSLLKDLKNMEQTHGLLPQLLFFTGDAAFGNYGSGKGSSLAEQYEEVETFLTGVRRAFSQEISKENTFLVPGNHDVDRGEVAESETHWIETQATTDNVTRLIKDKPRQWRLFMDRLTTYREFLKKNSYSHLLEDPDRLIYSQIREINGIKLGIGGFNSAWNCSRDKEKSKLWLGADWQDGAIVGNLDKLNADLKIALIHHPPGCFVEQEDALLRRIMETHFDFFLHGHEHQNWVNAINNQHVRIAAAACYEKSDQENGYNFVRLNLDTGDVEIWLRRYDGHGDGWIPRAVAGKTKDNGLWLTSIETKLC